MPYSPPRTTILRTKRTHLRKAKAIDERTTGATCEGDEEQRQKKSHYFAFLYFKC